MHPDLTEATIPLWGAIAIMVAIMGSVLGGAAWAFSYFESKADAKEKHDALSRRVATHDSIINGMAKDVAYIRGRLEPK